MATADLASFQSAPSTSQPPSDVVAFNELRSCADLYRLYKDDVLDIQPEFQRETVWKKTEQSTFIDSLVKQLPIPSMCFSLDHKTQKWQVVDGLQRMTAIVSFLNEEKEWRLSRIGTVDPRISGKSNYEIRNGDEESRILYRRVQNLSLPITVIRCDYSREDHAEYLFTIFHRLNAGGVRLNNQEIRNCIFSGPFNSLIRELDTSTDWSVVKELLPGKGSRFRSAELILRFFALHSHVDHYSGNLATFLNAYMREHRFSDTAALLALSNLFHQTVSLLVKAIKSAELANPPYTFIEAVMLGISHNLATLQNESSDKLGKRLAAFALSTSVTGESLKFDTTATEKVKDRVTQARALFA